MPLRGQSHGRCGQLPYNDLGVRIIDDVNDFGRQTRGSQVEQIARNSLDGCLRGIYVERFKNVVSAVADALSMWIPSSAYSYFFTQSGSDIYILPPEYLLSVRIAQAHELAFHQRFLSPEDSP